MYTTFGDIQKNLWDTLRLSVNGALVGSRIYLARDMTVSFDYVKLVDIRSYLTSSEIFDLSSITSNEYDSLNTTT